MSIKYKRQQINANTKNIEILEPSDKYFKEVVIKVFQKSIIKMVEKIKKKKKMTPQRKTKWNFGTENITEINNVRAQDQNKDSEEIVNLKREQ